MSIFKNIAKIFDPVLQGALGLGEDTGTNSGSRENARLREDTLRILDADRSTDGTAGLQQQTDRHVGFNDIGELEATGANAVADLGRGHNRGIRQGVTDVANQVNVKRDATRAKSLSNRVSDVSRGTFDRNTATMDLSDRQKRAGSRRLSLNRAVNEASAGSAVRSAGADASRNAMQAGVALESMAFGQEIAGLSGLANAEGLRKVRFENEKAQAEADRNAQGQQAIGIGLSAAAMMSSEEWKDKTEVAPKLLDKLKALRIDKWRYNGVVEDEEEHVGPYAEEFNEMFGTQKKDPRFINLIDAIGVTLGTVKELDIKVEALANGHG